MRNIELDNYATRILQGNGRKQDGGKVPMVGKKCVQMPTMGKCDALHYRVNGSRALQTMYSNYTAQGMYCAKSTFAASFSYSFTIKYDYEIKEYMCGSQIVTESNMDYYWKNADNPWKMLDEINFRGEQHATSNNSVDSISFILGTGDHAQIIPGSAVPRLKASDCAPLKANNDCLELNTCNYYGFHTESGKEYALAVKENGLVGQAFTEAVFDGCSYEEERVRASEILSRFCQNQSTVHLTDRFSKEEIKQTLKELGLTGDSFTIKVDGREQHYYWSKNGRLVNE